MGGWWGLGEGEGGGWGGGDGERGREEGLKREEWHLGPTGLNFLAVKSDRPGSCDATFLPQEYLSQDGFPSDKVSVQDKQLFKGIVLRCVWSLFGSSSIGRRVLTRVIMHAASFLNIEIARATY